MTTPALPSFHHGAAALAERNGRLPPDQRLEFTVQDLADDCWVSSERMERALVEAGLLHRGGLPTFTAMASGLAALSCAGPPDGAPGRVHTAVFCLAAIDCTDLVLPTPALRMSVCENVYEAATRLIDLLSQMADAMGLRSVATAGALAARSRALGLAPHYAAQIVAVLSHATPPSRQAPRFPLPTSALQPLPSAREAREGVRQLRRMTRPLIHAAAHQRMADHAEAADLLLQHLEEGWAALTCRRPVTSGRLAARALSAPSPGR